MRITRVTKIIVTLLMLTFIGQSVAAVSVSCMDKMPHCQEQMNGSSECMDMSAPESGKACADCGCGPGSCNTALLPTFQPTFEPTSTSLASHYARSIGNQLTVSLYRPPISR